MSDSDIWTVDRLAAQNLLADLKLEATPEMLEQVAGHCARHRESSYGWAVKRAHANVVQKLEVASMTCSDRKSDEWRDGFCFAEQQILTIMPDELLELGPDRPRTKGQILRALVRQARNR